MLRVWHSKKRRKIKKQQKESERENRTESIFSRSWERKSDMDPSVDDRFPLSFYYRIADQMVKQAAVFRNEGNADDLYITLKRYLRLVAEVIPSHRSYTKCSSKRKLHHSKILREFIKEMEDLKPLLETKNSEFSKQIPKRPNPGEANSHSMYQRWKEKNWALGSCKEGKVNHCSTIRTKDPNLEGNKVNSDLAPELAADTLNNCTLFHTPTPVALAAERKHGINVHAVKHHFPSPVLSFIESPPLVGHVSQITIPESRNEYLESSCEVSSSSQYIKDVHISARLMEEFMELARANTDEDLETCGILGASLKNQTFYITTLIIPRQESTSNSCQALNEEQIYAIQDERSLFTAGWIHTHPSQTCFLSSIDLHTQYSYQVMLPEAVAIVMAPTDPTRSYGIFRLTDPGGMAVLRHCQESGFHPHSETADGSPIYESCSNVYINPNLRFEIIDLRFRAP